MHQVVPRLKPGGMKKLHDGLEAQDTILLFRHFDGFTDKRKDYFNSIFSKNNFITLTIQAHEGHEEG